MAHGADGERLLGGRLGCGLAASAGDVRQRGRRQVRNRPGIRESGRSRVLSKPRACVRLQILLQVCCMHASVKWCWALASLQIRQRWMPRARRRSSELYVLVQGSAGVARCGRGARCADNSCSDSPGTGRQPAGRGRLWRRCVAACICVRRWPGSKELLWPDHMLQSHCCQCSSGSYLLFEAVLARKVVAVYSGAVRVVHCCASTLG